MKSSRRHFLRRRVLRALFAAALAGGCLAGQTRPLTVFHTNDLHARLLPLDSGAAGFAALAGLIRQERAGCQWCILLNAGDLVQGSPVSTIYRGLPVFRIANLFGINAATLGNHDFDYGWQRTMEFARMANYPVVLANVVNDSGKLLMKRPYVILKVNGMRVAVLGVDTDSLGELTTPALLGPWHESPLLKAVHAYAAEARAASDLLILLAHVTAPEEAELLKSAPEVPVIVTGHVHTGIPAAIERDGRVLVRVKSNGEELGRLDLQVDLQRKAVASWKWKHIPVDAASAAPAPDVAKAVAHWEKEVARAVDAPIAESRRAYTKSEVKTLIETAMRERLHADFAFMNLGGVRDVIPRGTVLARHIWNIMPFDNKVVVGKFKGNRLPEVVTAGRQIDPEREYTLAVSDFTAANQGAPTELRTKGLAFAEQDLLLRDLLVDWVKQKRVLE
jgi:2',3'-cyclic-nucleotide 2'-phosphodiesterase (5'-nucleotidase family)